jgi:hypothetical protein
MLHISMMNISLGDRLYISAKQFHPLCALEFSENQKRYVNAHWRVMISYNSSDMSNQLDGNGNSVDLRAYMQNSRRVVLLFIFNQRV